MEWKEVDIEQTSIEIIDGDRGKNYPKNNELTNSGYCLFLSAANVTKNGLQFSNNSFITKEKDALLRKGKLMPKDIVLTTRGTVGNVGFYSDDVPYPNMRINSGMVIIRPGEDFDTMFLYQYLRSCYFRAQITQFQSGSAQPQLPISTLQKMKVIKPDIDAQRRIASILSSLDRKIELNNKINADLEEMAQAIFKNWFVDFEPFKDGKFVDSELGMIPEGWKVGCLGDIAEITSGKRPPKKSKDKTKELFIPLIGASDIMGFTSDVLYERPILVIGRVGTHGVVQRFQEKCWPSDNTLVIESSYYNYVYQLLKGIDYSAINRGSTQPLITQTDVKNTDVIIAPENVLKEYESITSTLFSKHRANIKENSRLSLLRDTLLPRLMSGEQEVPE